MDLQTLRDERDIAYALGSFTRLIDGRRWDDLPTLFSEDVVFNYGSGGEQSSLAAMRGLFQFCLDNCGPTQHLIGSIMIDVKGDTAVSRAYIRARHQKRDDPCGAVFDSNGEYIDQWERRGQGWRIVRRDATWSTFVGDPAIIGMQGQIG